MGDGGAPLPNRSDRTTAGAIERAAIGHTPGCAVADAPGIKYRSGASGFAVATAERIAGRSANGSVACGGTCGCSVGTFQGATSTTTTGLLGCAAAFAAGRIECWDGLAITKRLSLSYRGKE